MPAHDSQAPNAPMRVEPRLDLEPLLRVGDVACIIGVSRATVCSWVNQRKIPTYESMGS